MHAEPSSNNRQPSLWHTIVVPTAVGVEKFFWNIAWFALVVAILFSGLLFPRHAAEGGPQGERSAKDRAIQAQSAGDEVPR